MNQNEKDLLAIFDDIPPEYNENQPYSEEEECQASQGMIAGGGGGGGGGGS